MIFIVFINIPFLYSFYQNKDETSNKKFRADQTHVSKEVKPNSRKYTPPRRPPTPSLEEIKNFIVPECCSPPLKPISPSKEIRNIKTENGNSRKNSRAQSEIK